MHAVGGLADSISEGPLGWGFRFDEESPAGLVQALDRALALFRDPRGWSAAMQRAMARDHSWDRAAEQYEALYKGWSGAHRLREANAASQNLHSAAPTLAALRLLPDNGSGTFFA